MPRFNQKGLTLIEVLVCLIILSGGMVYVVLALARSAEVARRLEDRYPLYSVLASKMAESEMRVAQQKDPLKVLKGGFSEGSQRYDWSVISRFENPDDEKAFKEEAISSALLRRTIQAGWNQGAKREGMMLETYARAVHPPSEAE